MGMGGDRGGQGLARGLKRGACTVADPPSVNRTPIECVGRKLPGGLPLVTRWASFADQILTIEGDLGRSLRFCHFSETLRYVDLLIPHK